MPLHVFVSNVQCLDAICVIMDGLVQGLADHNLNLPNEEVYFWYWTVNKVVF